MDTDQLLEKETIEFEYEDSSPIRIRFLNHVKC